MSKKIEITGKDRSDLLGTLDGDDLAAAISAIESNDWIALFRLFPKGERLTAFSSVKKYLSHEDYYRCLAWAWVNGEKGSLLHHVILELLTERPSEHRHHMMSFDEQKVFDNLPDTVTVYRGQEDEESLEGWSWTVNKKRAPFFAGGDGLVRGAKCKKRDLIAYKRGPEGEAESEEELIIDPKTVYATIDKPLDEFNAELQKEEPSSDAKKDSRKGWPMPNDEGLTNLAGIPLPKIDR